MFKTGRKHILFLFLGFVIVSVLTTIRFVKAGAIDCTGPDGFEANIELNGGGYIFCDGAKWYGWVHIGGRDSNIQFDNGSRVALGGENNFTWDDINYRMGVNDPSEDAELDVVGDIAYTGSVVDVSDIRLKDDIRPLQNSMEKLGALTPIAFQMKDDPEGRTEFGFSAQEMQKIYPELVTRDQDAMGTLHINYMGLIAPMIDAVRELDQDSRSLEKQADDLERRLNRLSPH